MPISRRTLIGLGAVIGGAALSGCSGGAPFPGSVFPGSGARPYCTPRSELISRARLGPARLIYDISGEATRFRFDPDFYRQLERWLTEFGELTGLPSPDRLHSFGSWTDGGDACDSWHNSGRAFDLARLVAGDQVQVSCRYDLWRAYSGTRLDFFRTRYWAFAASLHLHFAYVLTYLYDANHHNHIHVDNGRSGSDLSVFSTRSPSQVQAVQAMLNYLWNEPVPTTGDWDRETESAVDAVLQRQQIDRGIDSSTETWHAFLRASTSRIAPRE